MSGPGSALVSEAGNWPDTSAFAFEDIFVLPENGYPTNGQTASDRDKRPQKLLACARCHSQKLRCVRQHQNSRVCDRCLSANAECIRRQPQRMGRPVDWGDNPTQQPRGGRRKTTDHARAPRAVSPRSQIQYRRQQRNGNTNERGNDNGSAMPGMRSSGAALDALSESNNTHLNLVDQWIWPSPPRDSASLTSSNPNDRHAHESDSPSSSPAAPVAAAAASPSYGGPIIAGLGGLHGLLPNFNDVPDDLFRAEPRASSPEPQDAAPSAWTAEAGPVAPPTDDNQVEQLTKLHLELYQCLNLVKQIKTQKEASVLCGQSTNNLSGGVVDTSWMEKWFQTTERFIQALENHTGNVKQHQLGTADDAATGASRDSPSSRQSQRAPSPEIDTSTGLMIVSCYTRLLQILEVVVALVLVYRHNDCPGAMVQVRFGTFFPAANKMLHIRLVVQYILHLLEGASSAVSQAVGSRPMCASALAGIHVVEAKLRDGISAALN